MDVNKLHSFLLSFKLNGEVQTIVIEAINLRHAKEKILFSYDNVSDIRDWSDEKSGELIKYISKQNSPLRIETVKVNGVEPRTEMDNN
ncbi:MAG: hypothetical protein VKI81_11245 [Synechococcaceae cyanobacterium]|nr:hypothetical protein [Synechococcaceae cyanobacterium]